MPCLNCQSKSRRSGQRKGRLVRNGMFSGKKLKITPEASLPSFDGHVLILSPWLPSVANPLFGIFVQEQFEALVRHFPRIAFTLVDWSYGQYVITLGNPARATLNIGRYLGSRNVKFDFVEGNAIVVSCPCLCWNRKILQGNDKGIAIRTLRAVKLAESRFGPITGIHAHISHPGGYIASLLSERIGVPYVVTEHMSPFPFPEYRRKDGSVDERILQGLANAAAVMAVGPGLASDIQAVSSGTQVAIVPNMVNRVFFEQALYDIVPEGTFVFFTLGGISEQKGIDILIDAISILATSGVFDRTPCLFRIGGTGPRQSEYSDRAKRLGVDGLVEWIGSLSREETVTEFSSCRAFILPSRHETFGIVVAEAMACGKPVIVTSCGGPEHFVDEKCGCIVKPEDPEALAGAILRMVEGYSKFDGESIRKSCVGKFSSLVVTQKIMDMYIKCGIANAGN